MELRQLEYFIEIIKRGSFTKASNVLFVSQPSITNAIHKLEQELQLQLFDRSQKKPVLTAEGSYFYHEIKPVLAKIQTVLKELEKMRNLEQGVIKVAVSPIIGTYLFPNIFFQFKQYYPQLKVLIYEGAFWTALKMLEEGDADIGIIILPNHFDTLESKTITNVPWVACVAPNHPFTKQETVSFKELEKERLITLKKDSYHYSLTLAQFQQRGLKPNIVFASNQFQTIKALVAENMGIALLMDLALRNDPTVVAVSLAEPVILRVGVAWKKGAYLSNASRAFIEFVDHQLRNTVV